MIDVEGVEDEDMEDDAPVNNMSVW